MKKIILLLLAFVVIVIAADAQNASLFGVSSLTPSELTTDQQNFVNRISVTYEALSTSFVTVSAIDETQNDGVLSFALSSGQVLTATVFRTSHSEENTFVWTGKIDDAGNFISLAQNEGGTGGTIIYGDRFYSVHPIDPNNSLFVESDRNVHEKIVCDMEAQLGTTALAEEECTATECDGPIVDVLLVWTDQAAEWLLGFGNPFIIAIYGALGMESVNVAFANSGVSGEVRYRSFRYSGFNFTANPVSIRDDVLTLTNDPAIQTAREDFKTDLVILMTNQVYVNQLTGGQTFGRVNNFGPGIDNAFAIVEVPFILSPRWTLAHEIGHLFGALHNRIPNGGNDDTDICAHALRFTGNSGTEERTILALLGPDGERLLHYSNPDISFDGAATGTEEDDNAGRIDHTNCEVSEYFTPSLFNASISGSSDLCRCFPEEYIEFRDYRANVEVPSPPLSGLPPYTYAWHWNTSGVFSSNNPGNFISNAEAMRIDFDFPCDQFFLHLEVTSSDGQVRSHIRRVNTEDCVACTGIACLNSPEDRISQEAFISDALDGFSVFPNPASEQIVCHFSLVAEKQVGIQIVDISGKVVYELPKTLFLQGNHWHHIPPNVLAPGMYHCKYAVGKMHKTIKLVVL